MENLYLYGCINYMDLGLNIIVKFVVIQNIWEDELLINISPNESIVWE